jgi:hypothetical protein
MKRVNEATTIFMPYASAECRERYRERRCPELGVYVTLAWWRRARKAIDFRNAVGSSTAGTCGIRGTPMLRRMWLGHRWIPLILSFACRIMAPFFYHRAALRSYQRIKSALHLSRAMLLCLYGFWSTK